MRHAPTDTRGILKPRTGLERFTLQRTPPPAALVPWVDWVWSVSWRIPAGDQHQQETLPFPCAHLVWESGAFLVHGPSTKRFVRTLEGDAFATGVKFRPAGFFSFSRVPLPALVDNSRPARDVVAFSVRAKPKTAREATDLLLQWLAKNTPEADENVTMVNAVVELAQKDGSVLRAEGLAERAGVSVRSLNRLFEKYVGVGTKWVVRRARVQSAAERVKRGERVDWAQLADELGFSDQAHLIREFRAQVGLTPAAYAKACEQAAPSAKTLSENARSP